MGGLLHLVRRGGAWVGCGPAQSPPRCTKCDSPPSNGQCISHFIAMMVRCSAVLMWRLTDYMSVNYDESCCIHCRWCVRFDRGWIRRKSVIFVVVTSANQDGSISLNSLSAWSCILNRKKKQQNRRIFVCLSSVGKCIGIRARVVVTTVNARDDCDSSPISPARSECLALQFQTTPLWQPLPPGNRRRRRCWLASALYPFSSKRLAVFSVCFDNSSDIQHREDSLFPQVGTWQQNYYSWFVGFVQSNNKKLRSRIGKPRDIPYYLDLEVSLYHKLPSCHFTSVYIAFIRLLLNFFCPH